MSQKPYAGAQMSDTYAMQCHAWIAEVASARNGPRKTVLAQIAHETGLHARRVFAHFYKQVKAPTAAEWDALRRWREQEKDREMERLRARLAELAARDHR